jgi:hypothetical protein
MTFTQSF